MKFAIFGAGGTGGLIAARLAQAGQEVAVIARGEHLRAIQENGLQVESPEGDFSVSPALATNDPAEVGPVDAIILGVKAWQVPEASQAIRPHPPFPAGAHRGDPGRDRPGRHAGRRDAGPATAGARVGRRGAAARVLRSASPHPRFPPVLRPDPARLSSRVPRAGKLPPHRLSSVFSKIALNRCRTLSGIEHKEG